MQNKTMIVLMAGMIAIVVASNYLVQFPVQITIGGYNLADVLTWGAFTYPAAFLITDLTNRAFGPSKARLVVIIGFAVAVVLSAILAPVRIAIASGAAFLVAQLLDVFVFNKLRQGVWWRAPIISSTLGSVLDTTLFFSLAFAASFAVLGPSVPFLIESAPLLGLFATEAPRWVSLAAGDFVVKMLVAVAMLVPYSLLRNKISAQPA
ncbi:Putative preQ0 transporter YhhQ [hydrothermal vent metagenome]|uniref:PreQ0 transporter YhhQ n=1 Tax=hydrothermal vent metagenome TaxID=652676 RepID=A0A3B0SD83_9ZZZZ